MPTDTGAGTGGGAGDGTFRNREDGVCFAWFGLAESVCILSLFCHALNALSQSAYDRTVAALCEPEWDAIVTVAPASFLTAGALRSQFGFRRLPIDHLSRCSSILVSCSGMSAFWNTPFIMLSTSVGERYSGKSTSTMRSSSQDDSFVPCVAHDLLERDVVVDFAPSASQ